MLLCYSPPSGLCWALRVLCIVASALLTLLFTFQSWLLGTNQTTWETQCRTPCTAAPCTFLSRCTAESMHRVWHRWEQQCRSRITYLADLHPGARPFDRGLPTNLREVCMPCMPHAPPLEHAIANSVPPDGTLQPTVWRNAYWECC